MATPDAAVNGESPSANRTPRHSLDALPVLG
jgi:hypothetical protein